MLTQSTRKQKTVANRQFLRYRNWWYDACMIWCDTHSKMWFKLRDRYKVWQIQSSCQRQTGYFILNNWMFTPLVCDLPNVLFRLLIGKSINWKLLVKVDAKKNDALFVSTLCRRRSFYYFNDADVFYTRVNA